MTIEQKEHSINAFCDWLADKSYDNMLENKQESLNDMLYEYCCQLDNDDTFEDEFETYDTMANHVPEVIHFLRSVFNISERWYR